MNALISTSGGTGMAQPKSSARMAGKLGLGAAALGMAAFGAGVLASNGVAPATVIPVANYNFASVSLRTNTYQYVKTSPTPGDDTLITNWGVASSGYFAGLQNDSGTQYAFSATTSAVFYQDVGPLLANTLYTLTVSSSAAYSGSGGGTAQIALVETATDSNTTTQVATGTTLASENFTVGNEPAPLTYTTLATISPGDLTIELSQIADHPASSPNSEVFFTNVGLTSSAVPEPASLGLLAISGLGLLLVGRKRKLA
jgi:hypothetical protein